MPKKALLIALFGDQNLYVPKMLITPKTLFTRRATKAITDGWKAMEDEDKEEAGDDEETLEKEDSDSRGDTDDSELEEIFELF